MKYTNSTFRLGTLLLATFLSSGQLWAQSSFVSGAPSLSAYNAGVGPTENPDDPQIGDDHLARPGE